MSVDLMVPPDTRAGASAIRRFAGIAEQRYGTRLRGLFLFGSRARGDFSPLSDVDLAIVVDEAVDAPKETAPLSSATYDVLLETGAEVQAWVFHESEWNDPQRSSSPRLLRSAKRDAIAVRVDDGHAS